MLLNNQDGQPPKPMGGETFFARQRRVKGQQQAEMAGQPQGTGVQTPSQAPTRPAVASVAGPQFAHSESSDFASSSAAKPQGQPSTPVTGNGKIPDPQPAIAAPQPSTPMTFNPATGTAGHAPAPAPAAGGEDLQTVMARRMAAVQAGLPDPGIGGWNGAPAAPGGAPQPAAPPMGAPGAAPVPGMPQRPVGTELEGVDLGNQAFSAYKPTTFSTQTPEGFKGTQFSQWARPDQSALEGGQANLAQAILGNPESMSPEVVNQLKNSNKEAALLAAKQNEMRLAGNAAARGISGGGSEGANTRRLYDGVSSDILRANRDIDVNAANTNFNNRLSSLSAVDSILNSQMGRASTSFGNTLQGQSAQSASDRAAADSRLATAGFARQGEGMQADENFRGSESARQAQLDEQGRKISQFGINQAVTGNKQDNYKTDSANYFAGRDANRSDAALALQDKFGTRDADRGDRALDLQGELGRGGLSLDGRRLDESSRQFDQGHGLDILRFLEGKRQADNSLGYNYSALNQNGQNATMDQILRIINGGG